MGGICQAAVLAAGCGLICGASPALAADPAPGALSEVVVTADKAGLLEKRADAVVFGLDKPLVDTPRSASVISATTLARYAIRTVDDLTAVAPGTFTASFYGVPGTLDIRGTYAENYFEGFKLIDNLGTYATPLGDAAQIEIVRGPPSPIYGPGRVGGLLDFVPKSAGEGAADPTRASGEVDLTLGDYQKKTLAAQGGGPVDLGPLHGGLYAYVEADDSHSYYRGVYPKHQLAELSGRFRGPDHWRIAFDLQVYHSTGEVQTPGWNRLTQALIDDQVYITGRNTALSASPGAPYLSPAQTVIGGGAYPYAVGLEQAYFGAPISDPRFVLNTGVGATTLSPRDIYLSPFDFSDTQTPTAYFALVRDDLPVQGTAKLELFYNGLENRRFVSYGFPAWLRANVAEARATYDAKAAMLGGLLELDVISGLDFRHSQARDMQSYDSGVIALDRRDIAYGATPTDTICDPFLIGDTGDEVPSNCLGWETDIHSRIDDSGAFSTADISLGRLDLIVGGREDYYDVRSSDTGVLAAYDVPTTAAYSASRTLGTYTASASYRLPGGVRPYVTYAVDSALEYGQAGDLAPDLVRSGGWIRNSELSEAGVKAKLLSGALEGALAVYRQTRPELEASGPGFTVVNTVGKGEELEVRWVATRNLSFTATGNIQHTEVIGPDPSFTYIPAYTVCGMSLACSVNSFGGAYVVYAFDTLPGRSGNYADLAIPHSVASLYANYITDERSWGRAGLTLGATHTGKTSGDVPDPVVYPAYWLMNASAFYQYGRNEFDLSVSNVTNKLYFTPDADVYVNLAALPGIGREWRATYKRRF
jgi:iron complex outermembrane receptor protein